MKWLYVERSATVISIAGIVIGFFLKMGAFCYFCFGFAVAGCFYLGGRRIAMRYEIATLTSDSRALLDELVSSKGYVDVKDDRAYLNGEATRFNLATVNILLNRGFIRCDRGMIIGAKTVATFTLTPKGVLAHQMKIEP